MADMLKGFVTQTIKNEIKENYPHLQYPSCVRARVTVSATDTCTLKIIDKNGEIDQRFPEIPFVKTELELNTGDVVVVVMLYGECIPYIIGRYLE